ncbi:MAG: hypothetical protein P8074_20635 [Anaerolineales bacterium]
MAQEYANQPVIFLEYDVDQAPMIRYSRWWFAYQGSGSVLLPLVMTDSGQQISNGYVDFYNVYKNMVEQELARPAQAEIEAYAWRVGDRVRFSIKLTNLSGIPLSYPSNRATVFGIVYEEAKVGLTNRFVREVAYQDIQSELAPGSSAVFDLETSDLTGVDWGKLHFLALADYRPEESSELYDVLQAASAQLIDFRVQPEFLTLMVDPDEPASPFTPIELSGSHLLNWSASEDIPWLALSSDSGTVPASLSISIDTSSLSPGWQPEGKISFSATVGEQVLFTEELSVLTYYGPTARIYLPIIKR